MKSFTKYLFLSIFPFFGFTLLLFPILLSAETSSKRVFFVEPVDGAEVKSPVQVVMGVEGMKVKPAGEVKDGIGHHHIIVDGTPIEAGKPVPADEKHIHFGKGQTETEVKLPPGKHTLTLQFADGAHSSYGKDLSSTITVIVR